MKRRSESSRVDMWLIITLGFTGLWLLPLLWAPMTSSDLMLGSLRPVLLASGQSFSSAASQALTYFVGIGLASTPVGAAPLLLWYLGSASAALAHYLLLGADFSLLFLVAARLFSDSRLAALTVVFALTTAEPRLDTAVILGASLLGPAVVAALLLTIYGWFLAYENALHGYIFAVLGALFALAFSPGAAFLVGIASAAALAVASAAWPQRRSRNVAIAVASSCLVAAVFVDVRSLHIPAITWATLHFYFGLVCAGVPAAYRAIGHLHLGATPALYHWTGQSFRYVDDRFIFVPSAPFFASILAVVGAGIVAFLGRDMSLIAAPRLRRTFFAAGFGSILLALPALAVVFTLPNIPAFSSGIWWLEYFGFAFLAVAILQIVASRAQRYAPAVGYLLAVGTLATMIGNARAAQFVFASNLPNAAMRSLMISASRDRFFARLPRGATLYFSSNFAFMKGISTSPEAYAAFVRFYGGPAITAADFPSSHPYPKNSWLLQTSPTSQVPIDAVRIVARADGAIETNREIAMVPSPILARRLAGTHEGVRATATPFARGYILDAIRTCGPVPPAAALLEERPQIDWGAGFFALGPIGYPSSLEPMPQPKGSSYVPLSYPKYYMGAEAHATVVPTRCRPAPIHLTGIGLALGPGGLTINGGGRTIRIPLTTHPVHFSLMLPPTRKPISLRFSSSATAGNFHHLNSRYIFDRPESLHTMVEFDRVEEGASIHRHLGPHREHS